MTRAVIRHPTSTLLLVAALNLLAVTAPVTADPQQLPQLEIIERYALPLDGEVPFDVRWAGPDSVYVAYGESGVFELELTEGLPVRRQVFPGPDSMGFNRVPDLDVLATSRDWIVVAARSFHMAWRRPRATGGAYDVRVGDAKAAYLDFDLDHDRMVVLGLPTMEYSERKPGAIVWLGEIAAAGGTERWRPVYESDLVAERFGVVWERARFRGSVRFLDNGEFVVAPGFTEGVMRFSKTGKLEETWGAEELWPDAEDEGEWIGDNSTGDSDEGVAA